MHKSIHQVFHFFFSWYSSSAIKMAMNLGVTYRMCSHRVITWAPIFLAQAIV